MKNQVLSLVLIMSVVASVNAAERTAIAATVASVASAEAAALADSANSVARVANAVAQEANQAVTEASKEAVKEASLSLLEQVKTYSNAKGVDLDAASSRLSSAWNFVTVTHKNKSLAVATVAAAAAALYLTYKNCPVVRRKLDVAKAKVQQAYVNHTSQKQAPSEPQRFPRAPQV